eukprot:GILI01026023.1.p1 GENE.GILI01026023.1~~GILI01026023.1.p1  ORF type:complete len:384 (-),score=58.95 GILI01026023.1:101-1198(-)
MDNLLLQKWQDAIKQGNVFRSTLENYHSRVISGRLGLAVGFSQDLYNSKRVSNNVQRTEVFEDFDPDAFNFNKIDPKEILLKINLNSSSTQYAEHPTEVADWEEDGTHSIIVNTSPMALGHSLIPFYSKECLPQVLSPDVLLLCIQLMRLSQRDDLKLGFNSLAAWASVNHLHVHSLYVSEIFPDGLLPVEKAPLGFICDCPGWIGNKMYNVRISELIGYPVRGFAVQAHSYIIQDESADSEASEYQPIDGNDDGEWAEILADAAGVIVGLLLEGGRPHNVVVCDKGRKLYIIPRQAQKFCFEDHSLCAAWMEVAGFLQARTKALYDRINEEEAEAVLSQEVSLSEDQFEVIKYELLAVTNTVQG